ncbi:MAG: glycosyltransferase [Bryobacteraceae bacterium]
MKVSIIIPVYNEFRTFAQVLERVRNAPLPAGCSKEIVVIDDGSTDGTAQVLGQHARAGIVVAHHASVNAGKGAAIRIGIAQASGDIVLMQDGDLEYDPGDYERILKPIVSGRADVVYGSRFLGVPAGMAWKNRVANRILTFAANVLYGARLTDVETAYKAFRMPVLRAIPLACRRFEFCPEVTAKLRLLGYAIMEVPIRYNARGIAEGKKIRARDGFEALWTLIRYRFAPRSAIIMRPVLALALAGMALLRADVISGARTALAAGDFARADALVEADIARRGSAPDALEALSWIARAYLAANKMDEAERFASRTYQLAMTAKARHGIDADHHYQIALGAAIEVRAQVMNARGDKREALAFLRDELAQYRETPLGARIQKNINLLDLVGKPAPPLAVSAFLGAKPPELASLRGRPVLLFFWAHWCGDCKADAPVIARIREEFSGQGLAVIGPTELYGYVAGGADAAPAQERAYIEQVRERYYNSLNGMPVPLDGENFRVYGASTTPTLVLIDRGGIVRLYHPGSMTYDELAAAVRRVVGG